MHLLWGKIMKSRLAVCGLSSSSSRSAMEYWLISSSESMSYQWGFNFKWKQYMTDLVTEIQLLYMFTRNRVDSYTYIIPQVKSHWPQHQVTVVWPWSLNHRVQTSFFPVTVIYYYYTGGLYNDIHGYICDMYKNYNIIVYVNNFIT